MEQLTKIATSLIKDENWLNDLYKEFPKANVYLVGGIVRDSFLGRESKDMDLVIECVDKQQLNAFLIDHPELSVNEVGISFAVLKVSSKIRTYDVAIPRRDIKTAPGHKGFEIDDVDISITEDLQRRDFTINAMAFNIKTLELIDPHDGLYDLESRRLIPTYANSFIEDPLRILRGFQFVARFGLSIHETSTSILIHNALPLLTSISDERIFDEVRKLSTDLERGVFISLWRAFKVNQYLWPQFKNGDLDLIPKYLESHSECIYHMIDAAAPSSDTETFLKKPAIQIREKKEIASFQKLDHERPLTLDILLNIVDDFPEIRTKKNYAYLHLQDIPTTKELLITGDDLVEIGLKPGPMFKQTLNRLRSELMSWSSDSALRVNRNTQLAFVRALFHIKEK